jgi:DNA replication protein
MKNNLLLDVIKDGNIVVPLYLYKRIKDFKISLEEFIMLMYLYNKGNKIIFNPNTIKEDLGLELIDVMRIISSLTDNDLITVDVCTNEKGIREEYISLENFYNKLNLLTIKEANDKVIDNGIFAFVENEFSRTLSPSELEFIKAWLENGHSEEFIREAVKEASINGVSNLRYVDKILYEWSKKGFKTLDDIKKNKEEFRNKKQEKVEIFEYDWLDENED